jgi:hypothetical protein
MDETTPRPGSKLQLVFLLYAAAPEHREKAGAIDL